MFAGLEMGIISSFLWGFLSGIVSLIALGITLYLKFAKEGNGKKGSDTNEEIPNTVELLQRLGVSPKDIERVTNNGNAEQSPKKVPETMVERARSPHPRDGDEEGKYLYFSLNKYPVNSVTNYFSASVFALIR